MNIPMVDRCPTITPDEHHNLSDMSESPNLASSLSKTPLQTMLSALGSSLEKLVDSIKAFFEILHYIVFSSGSMES